MDSKEVAIRRIRKRKKLNKQWQVYLFINLILLLVWGLSGGGYFWPIWVIVFWGLSLAWEQWRFDHPEKAITDQEIQDELSRM